jgi:FkbM family methyltransferase
MFLKILNRITEKLDLKIINLGEFNEFSKYIHSNKVVLINSMEISETFIIKMIRSSKSQLGQDIFALQQNKLKRQGFFIEIGASDGIELSNTYLLEKEFGWKGILVEPAKNVQQKLKKNRKAKILNIALTSSEKPYISFSEKGVLSTVSDYKKLDLHGKDRRFSKKYLVKNDTLFNIVEKNKCPRIIDFLSLDTEGSEFDILHNFNFNKYKFRAICVEHNYSPNRNSIYKLLTRNGYKRILANLSEFDDWYIYTKNLT